MKKKNGKKRYFRRILRRLKQGLYLSLVIGGVYFLVAGVNYWMKHSEVFQLSQVEVTGTRYLTPEILTALIPLDLNKNIFELDILSIKTSLEAHPYVRFASIGKKFPGILKISIDERVPVAMILFNKIYLIDIEGYLLPKQLQNTNVADFPIISGISLKRLKPGMQISDERIVHTLSLVGLIRSSYPDLSTQISEILLKNNGDLSLILSGNGTRVEIGSENHNSKLAKLQHFLKYCQEQQMTGSISSINLNYENQIIVKEAD
jgi:cell division protein FtsQ